MSDENKKDVMPEGAENNGQNPEEEGQYQVVFRDIIPRVKPGFVLRKVGQAYMVMPTGPRMKEYEGMITLNETGAFLYKEAEKPDTTPAKLIEACQKEYGATDEEAKQAVDMFIKQCAQVGLFEYEEQIVPLTKEEKSDNE